MMRVFSVLCLVSCASIFLVSGLKATPVNQDIPQEIEERIINGQNVGQHEIPWQVSLRYNGRHICGGSVLSEYWVLTAAHCFPSHYPVNKYELVFGVHRRLGSTALQETRNIQKEFIHSHFEKRNLKKDVALVLLDRPLVFNQAIQPIALPKADSKIAIGSKCVVSGWGYTKVDQRVSGDILQKTTLTVADESHCSKTNNKILEVEHNSMLCAGDLHKSGGCHGDSGGPLACREGDKWVLRGVVSWGKPGCSLSYYTVFARVSHIVNWINGKAEDMCKTG